MALPNRVTPLGELVADPARGLVYGNRGCLHDDAGRIRRSHAGKRWIACRLEFKGWKRSALMQPGRFTELFFLDEATAFAAGHRPCALCRHEDYVRFSEIWRRRRSGDRNADAIDARLHEERLVARSRARRLYDVELATPPDGAFVVVGGDPHLVLGGELLRWTPAGYDERRTRPAAGSALLVTPPSLVAVLRTAWSGAVPLVHPSAT